MNIYRYEDVCIDQDREIISKKRKKDLKRDKLHIIQPHTFRPK